MHNASLGKAGRAFALAVRKSIAQPREATLSLRMALWVILVSLLPRITSLPRAHRISSLDVRSSSCGDHVETAAHLARTLDSLLRLDFFVFRRSCWKRAMVLHRFLALHGIDSQINFGLQKRTDGTVLGHAWLERCGRPLLEDAPGDYVVTFSLPHAAGCTHRQADRL